VTTKQTQGSKFNHEEQFRKSWEALIRTATAYPLVEQSPEDGNIESGWVYETDHQRYRFFIQLLDRTPYSDIEIDVEYQELDLEVKRWRVKTPPLNYELSFLKNFQENLLKNFSKY